VAPCGPEPSAENKYPTGGVDSRWTVLRKAIVDKASFLNTLKNQVRFGLATYTSDNNNLGTCPIMAKTTFALGNDMVVTAALPDVINKPFNYKGDTPTAAAIKAGAKMLADVAGHRQCGHRVASGATHRSQL
jgi:hypothetical protein